MEEKKSQFGGLGLERSYFSYRKMWSFMFKTFKKCLATASS